MDTPLASPPPGNMAAQPDDWADIHASLDSHGAATLPLLSASECRVLAALYEQDRLFRKRLVMQRHGFGQGEYKYFAAPVPPVVATLRAALFPPLAILANRWMERLGAPERYPATLAEFLARCHAAGQDKPTPLMLRYGPGDHNCLHQDLYGPLAFPLQVVILLSAPGRDFAGGEFVLTEQRPRMQSRVEVLRLQQGEAAVFAGSVRPVRGARGDYRVSMRHGVSRVHSGERITLGLIFHDAA